MLLATAKMAAGAARAPPRGKEEPEHSQDHPWSAPVGPDPENQKNPSKTPRMDEEELQDDLRLFPGGAALPARLRSFPAVYLSLALSSLLLLGLSALALARVSSISSKLHQEKPEWNFSSWDSFLFPCGADSREWEYFSGNCYYFSLARLSWERAREQCRERRADLAAVGSFAEQQFLMSRARNERFWIGLTDRNSEGNWEWVDGTDYKSSFTFWREGEPNDSGNNEDCAHLWISGKWNDVHCTFECFFVCERPLPQKSPFPH